MHLAPIAITDPADPRLDDIRNLNSSDSRPDLPGGRGLVIAEGSLVVPRLLASRYPVRSVVGFEGKLPVLQDVTCSATQPADGPVVYQVSRDVLREVAGFDMHGAWWPRRTASRNVQCRKSWRKFPQGRA